LHAQTQASVQSLSIHFFHAVSIHSPHLWHRVPASIFQFYIHTLAGYHGTPIEPSFSRKRNSLRDSAAKRANLPCHSAGGIRQADAERSALEEEIDQLALRGQLCGLTPTGDEIGIEERTGGGQQNLERTEISSACAGKEESVTSGTFRRSVR
jgi:hypothetical protein